MYSMSPLQDVLLPLFPLLHPILVFICFIYPSLYSPGQGVCCDSFTCMFVPDGAMNCSEENECAFSQTCKYPLFWFITAPCGIFLCVDAYANVFHKPSGGFRGCKCTPPLWRLVMYFCVNNYTSLSNDYAAVACSKNSQAQLHTLVLVPYTCTAVLDLIIFSLQRSTSHLQYSGRQ